MDSTSKTKDRKGEPADREIAVDATTEGDIAGRKDAPEPTASDASPATKEPTAAAGAAGRPTHHCLEGPAMEAAVSAATLRYGG
jgi:hypothetical protein